MNLQVKVLTSPMEQTRPLRSVLQLSSHPPLFCTLIVSNREGEEKAVRGPLDSFHNGTLLLSGRGRGADHRGRGSWLYQREASLCVVVGTGPRDLSAVLWTGLS